MKTVTKHFAWDWTELPSAAGAAWSETHRYDASGRLLERRRLPGLKATAHARPTISTDPRAGAIMREELARHGHAPHRSSQGQMSGPHW